MDLIKPKPQSINYFGCHISLDAFFSLHLELDKKVTESNNKINKNTIFLFLKKFLSLLRFFQDSLVPKKKIRYLAEMISPWNI